MMTAGVALATFFLRILITMNIMMARKRRRRREMIQRWQDLITFSFNFSLAYISKEWQLLSNRFVLFQSIRRKQN